MPELPEVERARRLAERICENQVTKALAPYVARESEIEGVAGVFILDERA